MDDNSHRPIDDDDADGDALRDVIRRNRSARRERLRAHIKLLHGEINKPLAAVVRDRVLHYLPACSLLRFRAVAPSWDRFISSPFFAHTQSHRNRCISGVFFGSPPSAYVHFPPASAHKIPNDVLPFLSACSVSVISSSNGLLLCFDEDTSTFYVCNPVTAAWYAVPCPPCDPGKDPSAVLIFLTGVYNFRPDYFIVLPFRIGDASSGFVGFQTFSSSVGGWWVSNEMCEVESLHSGSGIAAGGAAYWRTTMFTVVRYDPTADSVLTVPWPMGHVAGIRWAIGEMGDSGRVYCVAVTPTSVQVHMLLGKSGEWAMVESMGVIDARILNEAAAEEEREETEEEDEEVVEEQKEEEEAPWAVEADGEVLFNRRPWPLRFQGADSEILLWVSGKLVGIDLASKRLRMATAYGGPPRRDDYVPYISTLAAVPHLGDTKISISNPAAFSPPQSKRVRLEPAASDGISE
ncbi:uncharacterized protein LOC121984489 [Zingiber officinale]|uniref:F-box protein At3g26010-like beta-propeller domain-containing protein n=1 Tax=Zingiber officinale TaxID=94328 RepID=A0A8J5LQJ4_ZINOF|nr:uncharacterized protein LOC121984489 [Zingiber officinale]KAG6534175.1 hypothetical protein ZIOFF_008060 [Zingiber officinale]